MMNVLVPGSFRKIPSSKTERVTRFLEECQKIGVSKDELFTTADLIAKKNMVSYTVEEIITDSDQRG
jgi:hypothetical protein